MRAERALMQRSLIATLSLLTLVALPLAAATYHEGGDAVDGEMNVDENVGDNGEDVGGDTEESTFAGLSTTVVIILIVLAVLVVALIVAMASRP